MVRIIYILDKKYMSSILVMCSQLNDNRCNVLESDVSYCGPMYS